MVCRHKSPPVHWENPMTNLSGRCSWTKPTFRQEQSARRANIETVVGIFILMIGWRRSNCEINHKACVGKFERLLSTRTALFFSQREKVDRQFLRFASFCILPISIILSHAVAYCCGIYQKMRRMQLVLRHQSLTPPSPPILPPELSEF